METTSVTLRDCIPRPSALLQDLFVLPRHQLLTAVAEQVANGVLSVRAEHVRTAHLVDAAIGNMYGQGRQRHLAQRRMVYAANIDKTALAQMRVGEQVFGGLHDAGWDAS